MSSSSSSSQPRPLEQIRKETKAAQRAHHLRKDNQTLPDSIDALDNIGLTGSIYHHDGPYDAALASRNRSPKHAPLAAVKDSNTEALKATPAVNVQDALSRHVPLQGTATVPPGQADWSDESRIMRYEEGADLMREPSAGGGAYKRYDHIQYDPADLKGKGEGFKTERGLQPGNKTKGD
ncbi:hypothetical protein F5Y18DRAFT_282949 [Xylariaceae sp. FL1019]|nr:hypothetical protein F5Y18DRAFT_282949 [Xylariaceae sp. FL1019]